jgi:hypothetical protein
MVSAMATSPISSPCELVVEIQHQLLDGSPFFPGEASKTLDGIVVP